MQNITDMIRQEGQLSWWGTYQAFRGPELYLAEDMADFNENVSRLPYPWYKWFPYEDRQIYRAYITIYNIGLRSFYGMEKEAERHHFLVHDATGDAVMNWEPGREIFRPRNTFDEVHLQEGLTDDDWVFNIFLVYLIHEQLSYICEVQKVHPIQKQEEKISLLEQARDFISEPVPAFG